MWPNFGYITGDLHFNISQCSETDSNDDCEDRFPFMTIWQFRDRSDKNKREMAVIEIPGSKYSRVRGVKRIKGDLKERYYIHVSDIKLQKHYCDPEDWSWKMGKAIRNRRNCQCLLRKMREVQT